MKTITKLLIIAGLAVGFATSASADVVWVLNNVNFTDGASATGFFTTDPSFDALTDWSITVSGSGLGADYSYQPGNSNFFGISPTEVALASDPFAEFVIVFPNTPMTNAGGSIFLQTGFNVPPGSGDCSPAGPCGFLGENSYASITGTPTPEPRFGAILVIALAGLGFLARRKVVALRA